MRVTTRVNCLSVASQSVYLALSVSLYDCLNYYYNSFLKGWSKQFTEVFVIFTFLYFLFLPITITLFFFALFFSSANNSVKRAAEIFPDIAYSIRRHSWLEQVSTATKHTKKIIKNKKAASKCSWFIRKRFGLSLKSFFNPKRSNAEAMQTIENQVTLWHGKVNMALKTLKTKLRNLVMLKKMKIKVRLPAIKENI